MFFFSFQKIPTNDVSLKCTENDFQKLSKSRFFLRVPVKEIKKALHSMFLRKYVLVHLSCTNQFYYALSTGISGNIFPHKP